MVVMTMTPEEQTAIAITGISYEVVARDILEGMSRALRAGASRELILRDYTSNLVYDMDRGQWCSLAITLALMLAEGE